MITARSPYQIYKAENVSGSVSDFNSLSIEDVLPYKIASAEETLVASLTIVEVDEAQKARYAVSALHAASTYVSHLVSYVPLSARSQTAKKIEIHYDAIVRTVMLFGTDASLFQNVKNMVMRNAPANQVSLKDLSDLEGALTAMEKEHRQKAKDAGEKVDMLRKVAPEPVVVTPPSSVIKAQGSSAASIFDPSNAAAAPCVKQEMGKTDTSTTSNSRGQRRPRSQSVDMGAKRDVDSTKSSEAKVLKTEGLVAVVEGAVTSRSAASTRDDTSNKQAQSPARLRRAKGGAVAATSASGLVWGRLRGLTSNEKKAVGVLQTLIQLLAHIYASKFNDLVPLFDLMEEKVKTVQVIIDTERAQYEAKEDRKPPEPFHEVDLGSLRAALERSSHIFRTDEECRYELDDDLLHPIAHACLTLINHIEGYATEPYKLPTPEELEKKQQLRDAARAKREEAKRRTLEKAEAKAELERKRQEEKQLMRRRLGDQDDEDDELVEDATLANPSVLGYVAYAPVLPLGSPALYEKALYVWSMLVSMPRALNLSQMYFSTFVKGIMCEDQDSNGFMEEVTKCLLSVSMEVVRVSSAITPRITTRGKNWFDALVEFVGVASGNKKRRQNERRREPSTEREEVDEEEDEDDSDDSEDGSEDSNSSSDSSVNTGSASRQDEAKSNVAAEEAAQFEDGAAKSVGEAVTLAPEEEADTDPFILELKATMDNITRLRSLATWGNVDVVDRLNLLQFCVQEALSSEVVRNEADRLQKENEEEAISVDKKLKEIRDEAEKEMKALLRTLPTVTATTTTTTGKKRGRKAAGIEKSAKESTVKAEEDTDEQNSAVVSKEDNEEGNNNNGEGEGIQEKESATTAKNYETERESILQAADRKRAEAYAHFYGRQDGRDDGAVIEPLGMDRYHRLYWRFPLERVIFVQSVPYVTTADFPVLPEPEELRRQRYALGQCATLLDDEEIELSSRTRGRWAPKPQKIEEQEAETQSVANVQKQWGVIPFEYLTTFVQTLDRRGKREAPLRRALEGLAPYLSQLEELREGRLTRTRANMFGYLNRLKVDFSY